MSVDAKLLTLAAPKVSRMIAQSNMCRDVANRIRKHNRRDALRLDKHADTLQDMAAEELIESLGYADAKQKGSR